jgi:hypothetical protein
VKQCFKYQVSCIIVPSREGREEKNNEKRGAATADHYGEASSTFINWGVWLWIVKLLGNI